jgi:glyoxylase-like metal-dependent hydrolase (beta-lactamase superfamily II)
MLQISIVPVTPFQQNCSIVWCDQTKEGAVVDPGGDIDQILAVIQQHEIAVKQILLTHGHLDHVGGSQALAAELNVDIIGPHQGDDYWLDGLEKQSEMFGFPKTANFRPTRWLQHGETITVGNESVEVRHCPGHTPGHIVLISHLAEWVIAADVLFNGSIGRTDFPGGDFDTLAKSIRQQLYTLPPQYTVYPGHGPTTTIATELATNPMVKGL